MRKEIGILLLIFCLSTGLLTGCNNSKKTNSKTNTANQKVQSNINFTPSDYVSLGKYKGLEAYDVTVKITKEQVQEEIDADLESHATYTDITDRNAEKGDFITFDYTASVNGKAVRDCSEKDYEIRLGNNEFSKEIESRLIGTKPKDTITVTAKIPEELSETNAGDPAVFTLKIKKLQKEHLPKYDAAFVKKNSEYSSIKEYEAGIKNDLKSDAEEQYYNDTTAQLVKEAVSTADFKKNYPKELYTQAKQEFEDDCKYYADTFGISKKEYLAENGSQSEKEDILERVHEKLVIYAIAEKEQLFLTKKEYDSYVESVISEYGYDSKAALYKDYSEDSVRYAAVYDNVTTTLYENAKLKTITEDEYDKLNASESAENADAADAKTKSEE